jgi:2-keto-4-pentenoate hydratase/2-oxohepta-3-ene-1,7-dioic acid hydratase in catechol pathway
VTARDLQKDAQWAGQGFDSFCPVAPVAEGLTGATSRWAAEWRERQGAQLDMIFTIPDLLVHQC